MSVHKNGFIAWVVVVVLHLSAAPAVACNIPVFRYALDHWPSDPYRLTVLHRGPLTDEHREWLKVVDRHAGGDFPVVVLELVDLNVKPDAADGLPAAAMDGPWLVVRYPAPTRIEVPVWSGPLRPDVIAALLDSPARRELAQRILTGDSAVWILLTSGDTARDDAVEKWLRDEVQRLAKELKLPERTSAPQDQLPDDRPLKLAFSVLRVARNDPAEAMLVQMLLNTEDDLPGRSDPMVFPVFGRGRAMPALIGAGITPDNIEDAASFLAGPCTCEVKRDNPGVDLLMTANWGKTVAKPSSGSPIQPGTTVPIPRPDPGRVVTPERNPEPTAASEASTLPSWWQAVLLTGLGVAGVLTVITGSLVLRSRRRFTS